MTPDKVLEEIKALTGIKFTRATLTNYENRGLISKPERGSFGRGIGRWTNYPEKTVAEAITTYRLINGKYDFFTKSPPCIPIEIIAYTKKVIDISANNKYQSKHEIIKKNPVEIGMKNAIDCESEELFKAYQDFIEWASDVWEYEYKKFSN